MSRQTKIALLLAACVVCVALGIFYLIPGPYHPLTFSGTPTGSHLTHGLLFFALAIISLVATRFVPRGGPAGKR